MSPLVAAPKPQNPSEIRLCVDMRMVNQAVKREHHNIPTVEELMEEMAGATIFSKLDLRSGYHQIELEKESRHITTFRTHKGLYQYKRLPFGLSSAPEVFQHTIQQVLEGIQGTKSIADDIIVYGRNQESHDQALLKVFQRLREKGLTLNARKCSYNQRSLQFYGYTLSGASLSVDPAKVQAIQHSGIPQDVSQL